MVSPALAPMPVFKITHYYRVSVNWYANTLKLAARLAYFFCISVAAAAAVLQVVISHYLF